LPNKATHETRSDTLADGRRDGVDKVSLTLVKSAPPWRGRKADDIFAFFVSDRLSGDPTSFTIRSEPAGRMLPPFPSILHFANCQRDPAGLVIGYLATGVIVPGKGSPERWDIRETLKATGTAVAGALVSVVLFIPGLLLPIPWVMA
jgi:hypothetical protein